MKRRRFLSMLLICLLPALVAGWPHESAAAPDDDYTPWERNNMEVYEKASPGVVFITSTVVSWDYYLRPVPSKGSGSGAVVDKKGHIITNYHVVAGARYIEVTLFDGSRYPAVTIGTDATHDLAVIRINAPPEKLHPIPLGSSRRLKVGQKVLAIGNPFGLERTLTVGVISSISRDLMTPNGTVVHGIIQTDAAINPGNSGGPLLNSKGEIIGINTAIFSTSGGNIGIGFALPVDRVKRILPDLITTGRVRYAWLGVRLLTINGFTADLMNLPVQSGAMIASVLPGSPAEQAGLHGGRTKMLIGNTIVYAGGDIIVGVDGRKIESASEIVEYVEKKHPGDVISLEIVTPDGGRSTVEVTLGERPQSAYE